jgi:hypothetical protein
MGNTASAFDLHPFVVAADPSFLSSYAAAISDDGAIIGYATTAMSNYAVFWSPVPEPACVWLATAAFSGILFSRIRADKRYPLACYGSHPTRRTRYLTTSFPFGTATTPAIVETL